MKNFMTEKISSLHDDFQVPFHDRDKPEYDPGKGYPQRMDDIGENFEHSVFYRVKQFGITEQDLLQYGIKNPHSLDEREYDLLISEAARAQYDTLFASVFGHWDEIASEKQMDFIRQVSKRYRSWGLHLVGKGDALSSNSPNLVIALEGGDAIRSLADVDQIYSDGIGCVAPQYNTNNALTEEGGLSDLGVRAVRKMLDNNMIVDLAHALPRARQQIMDIAQKYERGKLIAYTHGATSDDIAKDPSFGSIADKRGLSHTELQRLLRIGGIIGLGVTRPFFQSLEQIANRIDHICQHNAGPTQLALGTDFGGVPPELAGATGIASVSDVAKIGDQLSARFGYSDAIIRNILQHNARNWLAG